MTSLLKAPQFFNDYFIYNKEIISRITRQSNLLHLPKVRTEAAKRSFFYNGCAVFLKDFSRDKLF